MATINHNNSFAFSTGYTFAYDDTYMDKVYKKQRIKEIIGDDKYLLQEIISELRKEKIENILNKK